MKAREDPRIIERIRERDKVYGRYGGKAYDHLYDSIRTYEDIAAMLLSADSNTLIVAMKGIVPLITGDLTSVQRKDLTQRIQRHLSDMRMWEFPYGGFQADEDDTTTVKEAANDALRKLEECLEEPN